VRYWLFAAAAIAFLAALACASAQNDPGPGGGTVVGDWIVEDARTYTGVTITLRGNLTVQSSGNLTLSNVMLVMDPASDGQYSIEVRNGGSFRATSGTTVTSTGHSYGFVVQKGGLGGIFSSTVENVGYSFDSWDHAGLAVHSNPFTLRGAVVRDSLAALCTDARPTISSLEVSGSRYGAVLINTSLNLSGLVSHDNWIGVYIQGGSPTIHNSDIENNTHSGIEVVSSSAAVVNSRIRWSRIGIYSLWHTGSIRGVTVSNCSIAIEAMSSNISVSGSTLSLTKDYYSSVDGSWRYGIMLVFSTATLQGNTITGPYDNAPLSEGIELRHSTATITNSTLHNFIRAGIYVSSDSDAVIAWNTVHSCYYRTIYVVSSRAVVHNNTLRDAYSGGILLVRSSGAVMDNTITNNGKYGISAMGLTEAGIIRGNTIVNTSIGIKLVRTSGVVERNNISRNLEGIHSENSRLSVENNTFDLNVYGLRCDQDSYLFFNNNTVKSGNYTIYLSDSVLYAYGNSILQSQMYSILITNDSYGYMEANLIAGNYWKGVYVVRSEAHFVENTFTSSGVGLYEEDALVYTVNNTFTFNTVGLYAMRGEVHMQDDSIANHSSQGVFVLEGYIECTGVEIETSAMGIYAEGARVVLRGTTIAKGETSLRTMRSTVQVYGSTLESPSKEGAYLVDSDATFVDSTVEPVKYGIVALQHTVLELHSTLITGGETGLDITSTSATLHDTTITLSNTTGISMDGGELHIYSSIFDSVRKGVDAAGGTLSVYSTYFTNCTEMGIYSSGTAVLIEESSFVDNQGGYYDLGNSAVTLRNSVFIRNDPIGVYMTSKSLDNNTWEITDNAVVKDSFILFRGTIHVRGGGYLTLDRAYMELYSTTFYASRLLVHANGELYTTGSTISSWDKRYGYIFDLEEDSVAVFRNTTVLYCGYNIDAGGVRIYSSDVDVMDSTFSNTTVGMVIRGASLEMHSVLLINLTTGASLQESTLTLVNSTLFNAPVPFELQDSDVTLVNTQCEPQRSTFKDFSSSVTVVWYMHVSVVWGDGTPVGNATVSVQEMDGKLYVKKTDSLGYAWYLAVRTEVHRGAGVWDSYNPLVITASHGSATAEKLYYLEESTTVSVVLEDAVPPQVNITSPDDQAVFTSPDITVTGTLDSLEDVAELYLTLDGTVFSITPALNWSITVHASEGNHTITVTAKDYVGNTGTDSVQVRLYLTAAGIVIYSPSEGDVVNTTSVSITGWTIPGSRLTCSRAPVHVDSYGNFSYTVNLTEGLNTLLFESTFGDLTSRRTLHITLDTTPPEIYLDFPTLTSEMCAEITIVTESESTVAVNGTDVALYGSRGVCTVALNHEGENTFTVAVRDPAGNVNSTSITIVRDTLPPKLVVDYPTGDLKLKKSTVLVMGSTEPGARVYVNGELAEVSHNGSFEYRLPLRVGENQVTINATDAAGNTVYANFTLKRYVVYESVLPWAALGAVAAAVGADAAMYAIFRRRSRKAAEEKEEPVYPEAPPAPQEAVEEEPVLEESEELEIEELPFEEEVLPEAAEPQPAAEEPAPEAVEEEAAEAEPEEEEDDFKKVMDDILRRL